MASLLKVKVNLRSRTRVVVVRECRDHALPGAGRPRTAAVNNYNPRLLAVLVSLAWVFRISSLLHQAETVTDPNADSSFRWRSAFGPLPTGGIRVCLPFHLLRLGMDSEKLVCHPSKRRLFRPERGFVFFVAPVSYFWEEIMPESLNTQVLIQRIQQGDHGAINELLQRYQARFLAASASGWGPNCVRRWSRWTLSRR